MSTSISYENPVTNHEVCLRFQCGLQVGFASARFRKGGQDFATGTVADCMS